MRASLARREYLGDEAAAAVVVVVEAAADRACSHVGVVGFLAETFDAHGLVRGYHCHDVAMHIYPSAPCPDITAYARGHGSGSGYGYVRASLGARLGDSGARLGDSGGRRGGESARRGEGARSRESACGRRGEGIPCARRGKGDACARRGGGACALEKLTCYSLTVFAPFGASFACDCFSVQLTGFFFVF